MKETTSMTASQVMEYSSGPAVTFIRVSTKKMNEMAMVRCTGQMEAAIKVNGSEASNTVTEK
jgi:hypothetical protein